MVESLTEGLHFAIIIKVPWPAWHVGGKLASREAYPRLRGGVSERFKEAVLKTVEPDEGSVGSNPTPSANNIW